MRFCYAILFLWFTPFLAYAQTNLVRNPSFEFDTIAPPIDQLNWHRYQYWMSDRASDAANPEIVLTQHWYQPTKGTSDYFNSWQSSHVGFATKNARTGKGRMGIIAGVCHHSLASWLIYQNGYAEYVSTRLTQPLEAGKTYCVRYYVALDRKSNFAAARMGAVLTRDSMRMPEYSEQIWQQQPQVMNDSNRYITANMGWVMICDTFIAKGGEEFLTLGNFDFYRPRNIHKVNRKLHGGIRWSPIDKFAYYYIDDVSVTEVPDDVPVCTVGRDSVARNNLILIIDIANNEESKNLPGTVQTAIHAMAQQINRGDLISIAVHTANGGTVLLENCPADSLVQLSNALSQIRFSEFGKKEFTVARSYEVLLKNQHRDINSRIVLITSGRASLLRDERRIIENAAYYHNAKFSIILLNELKPDRKTQQLAEETGGTISKATRETLERELQKQAPLEQQDTKYSGKKNYVIASWIFMSKVLPVLLVVILFGARGL